MNSKGLKLKRSHVLSLHSVIMSKCLKKSSFCEDNSYMAIHVFTEFGLYTRARKHINTHTHTHTNTHSQTPISIVVFVSDWLHKWKFLIKFGYIRLVASRITTAGGYDMFHFGTAAIPRFKEQLGRIISARLADRATSEGSQSRFAAARRRHPTPPPDRTREHDSPHPASVGSVKASEVTLTTDCAGRFTISSPHSLPPSPPPVSHPFTLARKHLRPLSFNRR